MFTHTCCPDVGARASVAQSTVTLSQLEDKPWEGRPSQGVPRPAGAAPSRNSAAALQPGVAGDGARFGAAAGQLPGAAGAPPADPRQAQPPRVTVIGARLSLHDVTGKNSH